MKKSGDTHPFLDWPSFILFHKSTFLRRVVREFERAIQQLSQVNFFADNLFGRCALTRFNEIATPNFNWRKPDSLRDVIHVPLHREQALRSSEAAKSPVRRRICSYGLRPNANMRPIIGAAGVNCAARKNHRRQGRIRSAVNRELDFPAKNFSALADRRAMP